MLLLLSVFLAAVALSACGSDAAGSGDDTAADIVPPSIEPTDPTIPSDDDTDTTEPPSQPADDLPIPGSSLTTAAFVGLTEADAAALAEQNGLPWRTVRIDDEHLAVTMDFSESRLNFGLDDGVVTEVSLG